MSVFSKYVERQIKKRGLKAFVIRIVEIAVKATPSKKDDILLAQIKDAIDKLDD